MTSLRTFTPSLDILPAPQVLLWSELHQIPEPFILYGGTGIALHLGHRQSIDFDFFAFADISVDDLLTSIPLLQNCEVVQRQENTLTVRVDRGGPVLISFFGVPTLGQVEAPLLAEDAGVRVAGLVDLAGMKANVVQLRASAKDYIDFCALLRNGVDLPLALAAGKGIYRERFNPQITLKALSYFEEEDLHTVPEDCVKTLKMAVRSVDLGKLPHLDVWREGQ